MEQNISPEGGVSAIVRTRDCGATTSETMWVSLQGRSNQKHDEPKEHVFVLKHIHRLHLSWRDRNTLFIDCRDCSSDDIRLQVAKLGPTLIEYQ